MLAPAGGHPRNFNPRPSLLPSFYIAPATDHPCTGASRGTAYDVFHNSEPNRWIKAPATIDHRFLNEDVPYGLVAIAELGHVAQVPTPCADAVIEIASIVAGRSYCRDGLTRDRMGIGAMTVSQVTTLLRTGHVGEA
jgi:opine dehydrogenase